MDIANYIVTDRATGREVARGTAQKCAATLGMTYASYLTMASRSKQGRTRYQIERTNGKTKAPPLYPCGGCVYTARCDQTGQVCDAWRRWFTASYDNAARQLRATVLQKGRKKPGDHSPGGDCKY